MSEKINDGGPAFTKTGRANDERRVEEEQIGMSLRDYFAAKELAKMKGPVMLDEQVHYDRLAEHCYRMADAMLRAREAS